MAACPYCKVYEGFLSDKCSCNSPNNPSNIKRGDETQNGVSFARCVRGEYQGLKFTDCPHYKKKR